MRRSHASTVAIGLASTLSLGLTACGSSTESAVSGSERSLSARAVSPPGSRADARQPNLATSVDGDLLAGPPRHGVELSAATDDVMATGGDAVPYSRAETIDLDDRDETPRAGEAPADLVPLGDLGATELAPPVDVAPHRVELAQPTPVPVVADGFAPVMLRPANDLLPGGSDPDASGGLVLTDATGCADHCIADAVIDTAGGSSSRYELSVDLESPAAVEAYLSLAPLERTADGRYLAPSSVPTAAGAGGFDWSTSFDLEPDTEYHLLLRATDEQGRSEVAGSFTTAEAVGPEQLTLPVPCADGCLEWVDTDIGDDGTELAFTVRAEVDVDLEIAWSLVPFVQGADGPTLEQASVQHVELTAGHLSTTRLLDRTPNTAHHVMITATDSTGGVDRMVASIATGSPTIHAGIDRVHVRGDGDDGRLDRGEISFSWGEVYSDGTGTHWGHRGEEKMPSNTTVRLGRDSASMISADGSGRYPAIRLLAGERDGAQARVCFVGASGRWEHSDTVTWCGRERTTWSSTYAPTMTLAEILALPTCEPFDVASPDADRCAWVHTPPNSPDQVSFDMIVWFDID